MTVSFYLKRPDSDNPTIIYARIYYGCYETKCYTDKSILPAYWNKKAKRARETKKYPQFPEFNTGLDTIANSIEAVIMNYQNNHDGFYPTPVQLKPLLDRAIRKVGISEKLTFMSFFDKFIKDSEAGTRLTKKGKPITHGTIKTYYTTKVSLENFQTHSRKSIDFDNIDMAFYNDFTKYLTLTVKQSTNYIGKHIKVIKTVLHEATELNINTNLSFKGRGFTTISEEADTIYLPEHELQEIAQLDLTETPGMDKTRDLFLIGCYTGLRFSDLSTLRPEQIDNGMITITQIKTGDRVVIPVHDTVTEMMRKYGGKLPAAISNQKTNAALKDIAGKCECLKKKVSVKFTKGGKSVTKGVNAEIVSPEKWQFVTTHTARRSFATNQFLNGVPTLSIMAITGHKTEKAFMKYIKVTPDDHAKIMQGIWKEKKVTRIAI
jgi:integrase